MPYVKFIDDQFTDYINRYITGIIKLNDRIEKIAVSYEIAESFGRHACRFYINVGFFNLGTFSSEEIRDANKYLYNSYNSSGSGFVSFVYQGNNDYDINIGVVSSFILHYEFAKRIFEGSIKNILSKNTTLTIESLNEEPFFSYISDFLSNADRIDDNLPFKEQYYKATGRSFKFDCDYHSTLLRAAEEHPISDKNNNIVTDEELKESGGCRILDIRKFVIDRRIPFSIFELSNVIHLIRIDADVLKKELKGYTPDTFTRIKPSVIIDLITKQENERIEQNLAWSKKIEALAIKQGDYVYVERDHSGSPNQQLGVIKHILVDSGGFEIKYAALNNDLSESRSQLKSTKEKYISFILKPEAFKEVVESLVVKHKRQLERVFKEKATRNQLFQ